MTKPGTSTRDSGHQAPRDVPRLLAYPLLFIVPIACIFFGILLGKNEVGAQLMLSSQHGTPVENWTLSLITASIALFMYASWAYGNRTLRARPTTFLLVFAYIAAIFVFGVWGLYAIAIPSVLCLSVWTMYKRRLAKSEEHKGQQE